MSFKSRLGISVATLALLLSGCGQSNTLQDTSAAPTSTSSESTDDKTPEVKIAQRPLWGDTHLHTSYSFDVFMFGTPAATPDGAYRFARGEKVESPTTGQEWQLDRPLDFLVVSDHAELMGNILRLYNGDENLGRTKSGKAILAEAGTGKDEELLNAYNYLTNTASGSVKDEKHKVTPKDIYTDLHGGKKRFDVWADITNTADRFNEPGNFTAMIGWEWSSHSNGSNLHRIVLSSSDAETAQKYLPFSSLESQRPEDLWAWLGQTKARTGADFVAIPHNPNVSRGHMFMLEDSDGNEITAEYAKKRMMWEPIVEMTQIKGDSETHPNLSPTDEFANFETFNFVLLPSGITTKANEAEYVRSALKRGLAVEAKTGVNPYKFGMIGSTDSHTGLSTSSETNFSGKGQKDSRPELRANPTGIGSSKGWDMGAAGLVAVWSPENNRDAIFSAFKRKEVYATTGTRMTVRFFAGQDIKGNAGDPVTEMTYESAVPMGGDIEPLEASPEFLVQAMKDPNGANLDRIQIVKGWLDKDGNTFEKVFDVAWSDEREFGPDGKLAAVGNTVDLTTGEYTNTIGAPILSRIWTDPEFNSSQSAFYYVRVLEIPTPRYSLLNSIAMGKDWRDTGRPATIQERAYSSPIWYTP